MAPKKKLARKPVRKTKARKPSERSHEAARLRIEAEARAHDEKVKAFGNRVIDIIEELNVPPTVAMDGMQTLLSISIGKMFGDEAQEMWNAYQSRFHEELSMILGMLNQIVEFNKKAEETQPPVVTEGDFVD
jgi:hypothetical protein